MPLYKSYTPQVKINNGTPTLTNIAETISSLSINNTTVTGVDGNGQAVVASIASTGNANGAYNAIALQNKNAGTLASADLVFYNNATTDSFNGPLFDIGMTSSTGANPLYPVLPIGAYMFTTNYHLAIGTLAANDVIFHTGGADTPNERLRIKSTGPVLVQNTTAIPAGGATTAYLGMGATAGLGIYYGSGVPTVSAAQGSLYMRTDGSSTSTRMYVNTNGTTGWTAVTTAA